VAKRELVRSLTACEDTVFGASLSPDGELFAFGCPDQTVRIHELATGKELQKSSYHENWVLDTVFSVDGTKVVSVGRDSAARVADVASGSFLETVNKLRGELTAVARHPTRDQVLIGGLDRTPYYYRMQRSKKMEIADDSTLIRELEMQQGEIFAVAFSPDGKQVAAAGFDGQVRIYNTADGKLLREFVPVPLEEKASQE
jgi:WD40 repeat protein